MSTTDNAGGKPGQAPASETQTDASQQPDDETQGETPKSFDEWLSKQDATTQELIETHTTGLRGSLQSERDARKKLEKQLRTMAKGAEEGSDLQKQLQALTASTREQNQRVEFYDEAGKAGVTAKNLKLAYFAAKTEGLMDERGRVDFDDLKSQFPELFATAERRPTVPPGNAGNGTREGPPKQALTGNAAVNFAIRRAAGRV